MENAKALYFKNRWELLVYKLKRKLAKKVLKNSLQNTICMI